MTLSARLAGGLFGFALILAGPSGRGANLFWTGAVDQDWTNGANWTPPGPPGTADNAHINQPPTSRIDSSVVSVHNISLADGAADSGTLKINGSVVNSVNNFVIGDGGTASVTMDSSVVNQSNNSTIGNQAGSTGDVTVTGSVWNAGSAGSFLRVGDAGIGSLTLRTSVVNSQMFDVGRQAGSTGSADIGITSVLNTVDAFIGNSGSGSMDIHDGALVATSGNATIGNNASGSGTVTVRGEDSTGTEPSRWDISGNLTVGDAGQGDLEVHNGGLANVNGNIRIGRQAGAVGTLLVEGLGAVSGAPSTLNTNNNLFVGGDSAGPGGQGELTIKNSGVVNVNNNMTVWGPGSNDRGTLSVDSTYTLNVGGTLTFVGGRLNFLGDGVDFANDATLTNAPGPDQNGMFANVSDDNTATMSGMLSGSGRLTKTGTGTLVMNNMFNSYNGGTNIDNGTLVVAVPGSPLGFGEVNLNGDINTVLRTSEGTPISYNIVQDFNANTGKLLVQVGGTNSGVDSDLITLTFGNANLDPVNSHLFVHRINGYNPNVGDTVTIIAASAGTVNGQFSDAPQLGTDGPAPNDFLGLIQPFADYGNIDANSVDLVFGFAASFASVAKTPNQIATATALDNALAAGCIIPATTLLGNQPLNTLRHTYDLIAPEELASMYEASFAQGMVQSLNLQRRMDDIRAGATGFCNEGFTLQDNHGYSKDGKSVADKNPAVEQQPAPDTRWGTFITGSGELTKTGQEDDNAAGYQLNQAGFTLGADYRVTDHWAVGLSGGYTHTRGVLVDNGRLNTDGGRMGLYTTYYTSGFYVDAAASGGWNQYDTRRSAFLGQETGSTDGAEFNGMVAAGYDWKKGCWLVGPVASFEYDYVQFNGFTESDTSLIPLHFPDQNQNAYRSNLGFRIAHQQTMKPGEGLTVVPELRAAWRHDFGSSAYAIDSNFVGCDDTFTVHGPWIGRDSAVVNLGLTAYCTERVSAYIFYDGQFGRDNYNNNGISGGFRVAF